MQGPFEKWKDNHDAGRDKITRYTAGAPPLPHHRDEQPLRGRLHPGENAIVTHKLMKIRLCCNPLKMRGSRGRTLITAAEINFVTGKKFLQKLKIELFFQSVPVTFLCDFSLLITDQF